MSGLMNAMKAGEMNATGVVSDPIGPKDTVSICGRYLCRDSDGSRFFMRGIAFPVAENDGYDAEGWIAILKQLASHGLDYNTIRIYRMDPKIDYSAFFEAAAEMGVYVVVPLTSAQGGGVLSREKRAPKCYNRKLYHYGTACLNNYMRYPNVLAGLLANEVMNTPETWSAAPCLKAYARDLKMYMGKEHGRTLPLIYAAQESPITPTADVVKSMKLTADYLACTPTSATQVSGVPTAPSLLASAKPNLAGSQALSIPHGSVDIFGVNIESWCGSNTTFALNPDGTEGTYKKLYDGLADATIPLVFTELGCSHLQFDKDTVVLSGGGPRGERDWGQIPVVLGSDMSDGWSGFSAYAYYGNPEFNMFEGGPWNGKDVLRPTGDFYKFQHSMQIGSQSLTVEKGFAAKAFTNTSNVPLSCKMVEANFRSYCGITLYDYERIPSHVNGGRHIALGVGITVLVLACLFVAIKRIRKKSLGSSEEVQTLGLALTSGGAATYQSVE